MFSDTIRKNINNKLGNNLLVDQMNYINYE